MKRMRSSTPNRKGIYEEHDVPSRKVQKLLNDGWTVIEDEQTVQGNGSGHALPEADGDEERVDDPELIATHKGGGYYRVATASGETVSESVTKGEAREMGAEV